ncbi:AAA family ATPase [Methylobacter tundripaludum]|uniref:ATPase-like protein n=1 Tax=Methylobacter tundripaludum (strain ATCC BAA-1195 / DSM 17260 / SV96) TaxID=697282 RepID=G3J0S3_METTV|nr:AAA family ATPase [Methylobacter tundripaludum]EGW20795.1 ATPase-like protein [Methylobacter tundripaludum SV96]
MSTFFNSVHITNFKSLKDVTLSDCRRINLLIGKPNVGKSNILEALGLFGVGYSRLNKNKKLTQFVRFNNIRELFFDGDTTQPIVIELNNNDRGSNVPSCRVDYQASKQRDLFGSFVLNNEQLLITLLFSDGKHSKLTVNSKLNIDITELGGLYDIKQYKFIHNSALENLNIPYLIPPFGTNLLNVIQEYKQLQKELRDIFSEYNLKLVIDTGNHELRIQKEIKDGLVFSLPYDSIADTLQRIIFFKAAIASNEDSILLFEEPEAHCFPPYITHIAKEIISSETNQFFIATHSPYILDTFLENRRDDLAIFMADFKDGQTVIKRLTDGELNDVYEYGLDLFFNSELFTDEL